MSDEEWDGENRRESESGTRDAWDGEDEEDDVKDAWDKSDSEEEKKEEEGGSEIKAVQKKKKKKLADILAEKEAAKLLEQERRAEDALASTPEAKLAEKMRLQKLEENANLQLAKDMMGIKGEGNIDAFVPVSKPDFEKFNKALHDKISSFSNSDHYNDFLESFVKNLCSDLQVSTATLKRIKMNVEALHSARLKAEKEAAARSKKLQKAGKAAGIRMDTNKDIFSADAGASRYDDMDDFM